MAARFPQKRSASTQEIAELPLMQPLLPKPTQSPALRWPRPRDEEIHVEKENQHLCSRRAPKGIDPVDPRMLLPQYSVHSLCVAGTSSSMLGKRPHLFRKTLSVSSSLTEETSQAIEVPVPGCAQNS